MAYFEDEWNNPIRSDYYLMQVACQAARVMNTKASQITPEMFKLEFKMETDQPSASKEEGLTKEQLSESVKRMWFSRTDYYKYHPRES